MTTHLDNLENCPLHERNPYGITNVTQTQFSVARFSMGCTFNGDHYVYIPPTDELIRADVLKWKQKEAGRSIASSMRAAKAESANLF